VPAARGGAGAALPASLAPGAGAAALALSWPSEPLGTLEAELAVLGVLGVLGMGPIALAEPGRTKGARDLRGKGS
jgi:hypothetical protein